MAHGLFIEPFYGGSHRAFADGLLANSKHEVELLTLPGERWRQRMRLGAQVLAQRVGELPCAYDFIVATDMLDLPAFLALTRPRFAHTPILLFMHENQFTYPRIRGTKLNSWFGQINYLSALAADRVAFNSPYHRDDFLDALRTLAGTPTNWLNEEAIDVIAGRASVLPIGLDLRWFDAQRPAGPRHGPPLILWNHRWEFDKAPSMFARAIEHLAGEDVSFEVAIAGDPGENPDPAMDHLRGAMPQRIVQFGHCEQREDYARLLWDASIVVSTARHEFFGIGTVEAMYCETTPVAPARLNYPNLVPAEMRERCLYETEEELVDLLRHRLARPEPPAERQALRSAAGRYDWSLVGPEWDTAIDDLMASNR